MMSLVAVQINSLFVVLCTEDERVLRRHGLVSDAPSGCAYELTKLRAH